MFAIDVAPGIVWVEIPEADLRIVCGCPADTVKHLLRRGLIRPTTVGGTPCESGPNAILLSDVIIQGGDFCNLAEFPILQMFYRQGMLLPGHPNNTGARPLLIGRHEQVEAQIQYIYRGNYGLISQEELMSTGVSAEDARDMMRLKLRFAFGRISHPSELLDRLALNDDAVEIRPGVTLRRLSLNVFAFCHNGQTLTVNLNLPPYQSYECPYSLGMTQFRRDYFAVLHSGEGDGWDIKRPSMGSILVYQGRIYLIDAGPNLVHCLRALGIGINEVEGIFQTHSHDDHFAGLTTLMQADRRVKYFAVPMVRAAVAKKLAALLSIEENSFSDYFDVRELTLNQWNVIDGLDVRPIFSPHPVETTVFHFRAMAPGGYRTYAHLADVVSLSVLESMVTDDSNRPGLDRFAYDTVVADYQRPADVKKVDIGGGLIHGCATDFAHDQSGKVILAHTSLPLSHEQKQIGSGASFGTMDVLISSHRDFLGRNTFHYLQDYFPSVSHSELGALLNGPVTTFNPETILIKGGTPHPCIYLLLTGQVEVLNRESDFRVELSAGALLGEMSGMHNTPSRETYRALSFVQVLEISCDLYIAFVQRHHLFAEITKLLESREVLSRTWLLGSVVSTGTLNAIAKNIRPRHYAAGTNLSRLDKSVGILQSGKVTRKVGDDLLEVLGPGDFFGEELAIFGAPAIASLQAEEDTVIYHITPSLLANIPNVRWKLFETFERRTRLENAVSHVGRAYLKWHEEYSVNIQRIDAQHIRLFNTANTLLDILESGNGLEQAAGALDFLLEYTTYHFAEEEALLQQYNYPFEDQHCQRHQALLGHVQDLKAQMASHVGLSSQDLLGFLRDWIVNHILIEDRKYTAFLNEQGVF